MNKILKSVEIYNKDYKDNGLPEYITLSYKNYKAGFIKSLEALLQLDSEQLKSKWENWSTDYNKFVKDHKFINFDNLFRIWVGKKLTRDKIVLEIEERNLENVYINYIIDDKQEKMNLNDLLLIVETLKPAGKGGAGYIYNLDMGKFNNLTYFYLVKCTSGNKELFLTATMYSKKDPEYPKSKLG